MSKYPPMTPELRALVGLHTASGRRQREIAESLGISAHRVSRLQIKLGLNPRRRLKKTQRSRERIVRLMTRAKESQAAIAKRIGTTRVAVFKIQKRLKLKQHVPDRVEPSAKTERMIVVLLQAGIPHSHIEHGLRVGLGKIKTIARRNGIPWKRKSKNG